MNQNNHNYVSSRERERESSKTWLWIVLGVVLISSSGFGIYYITQQKSENKNPDNPNTQYLPNEEEFQQKVEQIKSEKGLDDQQASIEVLTQYVPYINWWEINSLAELDEKINLVNSGASFPPFKEIPNSTKFNKETGQNFNLKKLFFVASVIPKEVNNTIDWKGIKDWTTYNITVLKPLIKDRKFKSNFATQENYQELTRRLKGEVNNNLSTTCSQFSSLSSLDSLNGLTNKYLSEVFRGYTYDNIREGLEEQLAIMPPQTQSFYLQKTGNRSENHGFKIALNELAFKSNRPDPDPEPTPEQLLEIKTNANQEIINARFEGETWSQITDKAELKENWEQKIWDATNKGQVNSIKQEALKDITELKICSPQKRLKLKGYFIFNLGWEIGNIHVDGDHNVRNLRDDIMTDDLNQTIKGNPKSTWKREYIAFTGNFNINNASDATRFDNLINSDEGKTTWIVFKKNHNQPQYHTERNTFFLRKGEPDYHEFKSRKEAINWLRQNDNYFK